MATTALRRVVGVLSSLLIAMLTVAGLGAPAHAEDGFRYWHYFHLEGEAWAFSEVGPADYQPRDGDVEGFRFGTSTMAQPIEPRADLQEVDFDTVCAEAEAAAGEKRVAVVVDYGTEEGQGTPPEPRADCAVVDEAASTQQIMDEVAEVRLDSGMMCALDGYPASGCGDPVKNADVPTDEEPVAFTMPSDTGQEDGTSEAAVESEADELPWALIGLAALVALLAVGALVVARRRKTA